MDNARSTEQNASGVLNTRKVRFLMAQRQLSQKALAKRIGRTEMSVSRYLNHVYDPPIHMIQMIADALGTTVEFLISPSSVIVEDEMNVVLDKGAFLPERAHGTDAGLDLRSTEDVTVPPLGSAVIDTGVHVEIPRQCAGVLISKSGLNVKHNITSTGLIDEGYTGSIRVKLYNHGNVPYEVNRGDKISQLVIVPVRYLGVQKVDKFETETDRGDGGFGSSGK